MNYLSKLINRLAEHDISVYLDKTGNVKIRLPTDDPMTLPDEVKALLRELKANKDRVQEYLTFLNSGGDPFVLSDVRKQIFNGIDPLDFRFDVDKQQWVIDPGWWKRIPKEKLH
ncbi:MAG: hypothetical protein K6U04_15735 [Armatimonadetes bacterium]|nr:hypothetical protein [Armatimonadota bacterium]